MGVYKFGMFYNYLQLNTFKITNISHACKVQPNL